jgi:quinol monooxygenase YgiN
MIIRVVRMTFQQDKVDEFLEIFDKSKEKIRARNGCEHLELLQDVHQPNVYTTYSYWQSEVNLNEYRDSELFEAVWRDTKALFSDRAMAHSYQQKIKL